MVLVAKFRARGERVRRPLGFRVCEGRVRQPLGFWLCNFACARGGFGGRWVLNQVKFKQINPNLIEPGRIQV